MFKNLRNNTNGAANTWNVFVGIHDFFEEGKWVNIFSLPLSLAGYERWAIIEGTKQPDNGKGQEYYYEGPENCGALTVGEPGFNDVPCWMEFAYFCEKYPE